MDPTISALAGACVALFSTLYTQRQNNRAKEKTAKTEWVISEQRFQRSNLLELQRELRSLTGIAFQDYAINWAQIEEEESTDLHKFREAVTQVTLLAERIADDVVREKLIQLKNDTCELVSAKYLEDAHLLNDIVMVSSSEVNVLIGQEIRRLGHYCGP